MIKLIRASRDAEVANDELQTRFGLSERQAKAILNMRLARLTGLEMAKLEDELAEVRARIGDLRDILESHPRRMLIISNELRELAEKFGDDRNTEIVGASSDLDVEDLIAEEDMVLTVSHQGWVKRVPVGTYRAQRRGGRGLQGMGPKDEDLGGAPVRGLHPRLPDGVHPLRPVPLAQGLGDPGGRAPGQGQADREPAQHDARRGGRRARAGARVQRRSPPAFLPAQGA